LLGFGASKSTSAAMKFSERALESTDSSYHPKYFITAFESCDVGTDFFDSSRHVQSKHSWEQLLGMRCFASPDLRIKRIDATGPNSDQNVIRSESRAWEICLAKLPTRFLDNISVHGNLFFFYLGPGF
jgi:hypothetical protein